MDEAYTALRIRESLNKSRSLLEEYRVSNNEKTNKASQIIANYLFDIEELIGPSKIVATIMDEHLKSEIINLRNLLFEISSSFDIDGAAEPTMEETDSSIEKTNKYHMHRLSIILREMNDHEMMTRVVYMLRLLRVKAVKNNARAGRSSSSCVKQLRIQKAAEVLQVLDRLKCNHLIGRELNGKDTLLLQHGLHDLKRFLEDIMHQKDPDLDSLKLAIVCWSCPEIEMISHRLDRTPLKTTQAFYASKHIMKELTDMDSGGISVLSLPSNDKTKKSLVEIFNSIQVKDHFGVRLWVHASDRSNMVKFPKLLPDRISNVMRRFKTYEKVERWNDEYQPRRTNGWQKLRRSKIKKPKGIIEQEVREKKFILIMENVLEDQMFQLEDLFTSLEKGGTGSKVIITSPSRNVLESIGKLNIHGDLPDISLRLFETFAFDDHVPSNSEEILNHIGRNISRILRQYPLAMKMIGRALRVNHDVRYWKGIFDEVSELIGSLLGGEGELETLLQLLGLCYNQLPAPLCCCFTYCSLFPRDWKFEPEEMVKLWMSQGFILTDEKESIQDVGLSYFNELVSRSFFDPVIVDGHSSYYTMHPVVHNLAEIISGKEFFRIERNYTSRNLVETKHLSITAGKIPFLDFVELDQLITLIILGSSESDFSDILKNSIKKLTKIRTLYLAGSFIIELPETNRTSLKHQPNPNKPNGTGTPLEYLRYLNLSDTGLCKLPESFHELCLLEVLNLHGCFLERLPNGTEYLVNLKHVNGPSTLISTLSHIGKLTNLQELEMFHVGNEEGHEISQLGGLSMIGGSLSITNLQNVHNENEASNARLSEKTRLKSLKLEWSYEAKINSDIPDQLKPPDSIEVLEIKGYPGSRSPNWLENDWLENIVEISLTNCMNMESFPRITFLPHLKILKLYNLPSIEKIGDELCSPSLEEILVEHVAKLNAIVTVENNGENFPFLRHFVIGDCPLLEVIPEICYPVLTNVVMERVGLSKITLGMCESRDEESTLSVKVTECPKLRSIEGSTNRSITELIVEKCPELSTIEPSVFTDLVHFEIIGCDNLELSLPIKSMANLEKLQILRCPQVKIENSEEEAEVMDTTHTPPSLRILHIDNISLINELILKRVLFEALIIEDCPQLTSLTIPMTVSLLLKELCLTNCKNLKTLERNMKVFSSLERLFMKNCAKISSLPDLPMGLEELQIIDCPILEKRCHKDGPDWSKISHIPYKSIDSHPDLSTELEEVQISDGPVLKKRCDKDEPDWSNTHNPNDSIEEMEQIEIEHMPIQSAEEVGLEHLSIQSGTSTSTVQEVELQIVDHVMNEMDYAQRYNNLVKEAKDSINELLNFVMDIENRPHTDGMVLTRATESCIRDVKALEKEVEAMVVACENTECSNQAKLVKRAEKTINKIKNLKDKMSTLTLIYHLPPPSYSSRGMIRSA